MEYGSEQWCITLLMRKRFWPRSIKRVLFLHDQKAQGKCLNFTSCSWVLETTYSV